MNVHCAEPSDEKGKFMAFNENSINMSGPGHVRNEMYTKIPTPFVHEIKLHR